MLSKNKSKVRTSSFMASIQHCTKGQQLLEVLASSIKIKGNRKHKNQRKKKKHNTVFIQKQMMVYKFQKNFKLISEFRKVTGYRSIQNSVMYLYTRNN